MRVDMSNNNNNNNKDNIDYSLDKFIQYENLEQNATRNRINNESIVPITGPPGTGKSTVISHCCLRPFERIFSCLSYSSN